MRRRGTLLKLAAGLAVLTGPALARAAGDAPAAVAVRPTYGAFGIDLSGMDASILPGDDFSGYVNGTYLKTTPIPADHARYGMFDKLRDLSLDRTRVIAEAAAADTGAKPGTEVRKVGDFYATFMDEAAIEAKGLSALKPRLDAIAAIGDRAGLARAFGEAIRIGVGAPVQIRARQDLKNPDVFAYYMGQGGLGMPDRDYYLEAKFALTREKYLDHVTAMLRLAGFSSPEARAKAILALETRLAEAHWTRVERRQTEKTYNPAEVAGLDKAYPGLDWAAFLASSGCPGARRVVVAEPSAVAGAARLIASEPLETWKDYQAFHLLEAAAPFLPKAFVDEHFSFHGKVLSGQPEDQPRWKRGVEITSRALGEAVGRMYVAKYFPPEAKQQADLLVKHLIAAMDHRLANLTWMDPATRSEARAKLAAFKPKIGYPDRWRDYARLEVVRGDAVGNAFRAAEFEHQRQLDKVGKPIDRSEWGMAPMTVNAYANPQWNEIVFPAAILQPPFFDPAADAAVNYGGIGVVIGHEISHHFDDQGRKFDKTGKLADWWTPEDVKRFKALTDKVVKQYSAYEPLKGSHVNGELTLGENMADLAGVNVALDAYHDSLGGKPAPVLDGFTGDQRFFMGFAQVWRDKFRDPALLRALTTDPHTPGFLRPNVVRNLDAWYQAFGAKPGQALYLAPEDRIKVW